MENKENTYNNLEQYYHDINRIANALEKLVQISPLSEEQNEEIIKKLWINRLTFTRQ